ncbi:MAG: host attachment protein [Steroidobacteraceae bacterium]
MATLVLVCDRSAARFFHRESRRKGAPLEEKAILVSPAARLRPTEINSDRAGRIYARSATSTGRHSVRGHTPGPDREPHRVIAERFAKRIARRLDRERQSGDYDRIVLVASPRFLGTLRAALSAATRTLLAEELPRDWVRADVTQIRKRL